MEGRLQRVLIGAATILAFIIVYHRNPENLPYAQTIAFATLVLAQLIHVFDCRSETSVFPEIRFKICTYWAQYCHQFC